MHIFNFVYILKCKISMFYEMLLMLYLLNYLNEKRVINEPRLGLNTLLSLFAKCITCVL